MSDFDRFLSRGRGQFQTPAPEADEGERDQQLSAYRRDLAMRRRWVQRKASGETQGRANIPEGGGAPLGASTRRGMEKHLGADLSGVRVHTGGDSVKAASQLGARAFTVGSDVHFGGGEFAPGTKEGDRLLAHELTHVVQGQQSGIQRKSKGEKPEGEGEHEGEQHEAEGEQQEVSEPGEAPEQEADAMGDHVAEEMHGGGEGGDDEKGEHGGEAGGGKKAKDQKGEKRGDKKAAKGKKEGEHEKEGAEAEGEEGEKGEPKTKEKAPPIAGKLEAGVSRKVYLAKAKPAAAPGKPAAPKKDPKEEAATKKCDEAKKACLIEVNDKNLPGRLEHWMKEVKGLGKFAVVDDTVKALEKKQDEVTAYCTKVMTDKTNEMAKLPKNAPASWKAALAMMKDEDVVLLNAHFPKNDAVVAYNKAYMDKRHEIAAERDRLCDEAIGKIQAVPTKPDPKHPDPAAELDKFMDPLLPWFGAGVENITKEEAAKKALQAKLKECEAAKEAAKKEPKPEAAHPAGGGANPAAPGAKPPEAHKEEPAHEKPPAPAAHEPPPVKPADGPKAEHADHAPHDEHGKKEEKKDEGHGKKEEGKHHEDPEKEKAKEKERELFEAKKELVKAKLLHQADKTKGLLGAANLGLATIATLAATGQIHLALPAAGALVVTKVTLAITKFMKHSKDKVIAAEVDKVETMAELDIMLQVASETEEELKTLKILLEQHKKEREEKEAEEKKKGKKAEAKPEAPKHEEEHKHDEEKHEKKGAASAKGGEEEEAPPEAKDKSKDKDKKSFAQKAGHVVHEGVEKGEKIEPGLDVGAVAAEGGAEVAKEVGKEGLAHAGEIASHVLDGIGGFIAAAGSAFELKEWLHSGKELEQAEDKLAQLEGGDKEKGKEKDKK